jgi:hypothetical protein
MIAPATLDCGAWLLLDEHGGLAGLLLQLRASFAFLNSLRE